MTIFVLKEKCSFWKKKKKKNHPEIGESKQAVTQPSDRELKIKSACQTSSQAGLHVVKDWLVIVDQLSSSSSSSSCHVTLLDALQGKMIGYTTNSSKWEQLYVDMIVCHSVHF